MRKFLYVFLFLFLTCSMSLKVYATSNDKDSVLFSKFKNNVNDICENKTIGDEDKIKYDIIFNPYAHRGQSIESLKALIDTLTEKNIAYCVHKTQYPTHATEIVKNITQSDKLKNIIIVGGDGTIFEVVNGCKNFKNVTFGIVPSGTGNDVAKMLGIPSDAHAAIEVILKNNVTKIDLTTINNFIKMTLFASYGIVIDIIQDCKKLKMKNKIHYYLYLLKNLFFYKAEKYKVTVDKVTKIYQAIFVSVQNSPCIGGGMYTCSSANPKDKFLDLVIVKDCSIFKRIYIFLSLLKKSFSNLADVDHSMVTNVKIEVLKEDALCCIDGEIENINTLEAKISPSEINFYIPTGK